MDLIKKISPGIIHPKRRTEQNNKFAISGKISKIANLSWKTLADVFKISDSPPFVLNENLKCLRSPQSEQKRNSLNTSKNLRAIVPLVNPIKS